MRKVFIFVPIVMVVLMVLVFIFKYEPTMEQKAFIMDRQSNIQIEEFNGSGDSMIPLIKSGSVLTIQRIPYNQLDVGMVVVYKKDQFVYVCHALVRETVNGWVAKGTNNEYEDDTLVVDRNYMGVVVK